MTRIQTCSDKVKRLKPRGRFNIPAPECTLTRIQAYYRAAKKLGIKVSIKNTPDGMCLWRIA